MALDQKESEEMKRRLEELAAEQRELCGQEKSKEEKGVAS